MHRGSCGTPTSGRQIFNDAWREKWGFVPIREEEFAYLARELRPLLAAQLSFLAEVNGEPASFLVVIRDLSPILARVPSGRLFPTGLLKLLNGCAPDPSRANRSARNP